MIILVELWNFFRLSFEVAGVLYVDWGVCVFDLCIKLI